MIYSAVIRLVPPLAMLKLHMLLYFILCIQCCILIASYNLISNVISYVLVDVTQGGH